MSKPKVINKRYFTEGDAHIEDASTASQTEGENDFRFSTKYPTKKNNAHYFRDSEISGYYSDDEAFTEQSVS